MDGWILFKYGAVAYMEIQTHTRSDFCIIYSLKGLSTSTSCTRFLPEDWETNIWLNWHVQSHQANMPMVDYYNKGLTEEHVKLIFAFTVDISTTTSQPVRLWELS